MYRPYIYKESLTVIKSEKTIRIVTHLLRRFKMYLRHRSCRNGFMYFYLYFYLYFYYDY